MAALDDVKMVIDKVVAGNNHLAVNLYKLLARGGDNCFFSPFSLYSSFAMLLQGVTDETSLEILSSLKCENIRNDMFCCAFQELISSLEKFPEGCTVSYANSVVIDKSFVLNENFVSSLNKCFKTFPFQVDFSDTMRAVKDINNWVKDKTQGNVAEVLETIDTATIFLILNVLYFKGYWAKQFNKKSTFMQYFYKDGNEEEPPLVEMMHLNDTFLFIEKETFKVIQLPYKGNEIAMLILLPNSKDGLEELEDLLNPNSITDIKNEMTQNKIEVALPKFRIDCVKSLKDILKETGMVLLFTDSSDFSGVSETKDFSVSQLIHKAVFEVTEEGCEVEIPPDIPTIYRAIDFCPEFIADHPFLFVVYNVINDLIIFVGRVKNL